jgi:hypothetical protein
MSMGDPGPRTERLDDGGPSRARADVDHVTTHAERYPDLPEALCVWGRTRLWTWPDVEKRAKVAGRLKWSSPARAAALGGIGETP